MENKSGFWKWIAAAVLVVVIGLGLGFYISGSPNEDTNISKAEDTAPADIASSPSAASVSSTSEVQAGEFTAKGAPDIQIDEQSPAAKPKAVVKPPTSSTSATSATTESTSAAPDVTPPSPPPSLDAPTNTEPGVPPPTATVEPPATPAHTDIPAAPQPSPTPAPAPQAQQPPADSNPAPASQASSADTGPLYHVLVGATFENEKNARNFAEDLRHRGFMAMMSMVPSDSGTVYKVQVGAYHSRLAAEQTASQLQQSGYPAYIATDR